MLRQDFIPFVAYRRQDRIAFQKRTAEVEQPAYRPALAAGDQLALVGTIEAGRQPSVGPLAMNEIFGLTPMECAPSPNT